jgi:hypothetical protein
MNGWFDAPARQPSRRISVTLLVRRLTSSLIDIATSFCLWIRRSRLDRCI